MSSCQTNESTEIQGNGRAIEHYKEGLHLNLMIGVGGWAYFPSKPSLKLRMCAELYDFVEVNSTFYSIPSSESLKKWRESVPASFEFTARANRKLIHENHLRPPESFELFDRDALIATFSELGYCTFSSLPTSKWTVRY